MAASCASLSTEGLDSRTLSYGCNDIVVIGRLKSEAVEDAYSEDDLLGHGWFNAKLHVRRIVAGVARPASFHVKYFAHTNIRNDRDFMFVLTPANGSFEIATARLMSAKPRATSTCR
jgi:hypothetical protein